MISSWFVTINYFLVREKTAENIISTWKVLKTLGDQSNRQHSTGIPRQE